MGADGDGTKMAKGAKEQEVQVDGLLRLVVGSASLIIHWIDQRLVG